MLPNSNASPNPPQNIPTVHTLLTEILKRLRDIDARLTAQAQALADAPKPRKRTPSPTETPERVLASLEHYIKDFFEQHHTPLHLHKITRLFQRRFAALGLSAFAFVKSPEVEAALKVIHSDTGAVMLLTHEGWDNADDASRSLWLCASDQELQDTRQAYRELKNSLKAQAQTGTEPTLLTNSALTPKPEGEGTQK